MMMITFARFLRTLFWYVWESDLSDELLNNFDVGWSKRDA